MAQRSTADVERDVMTIAAGRAGCNLGQSFCQNRQVFEKNCHILESPHSKCSVHPVTNVQTDATTNTYLIFSSPQNHNDGEARCRNTTTRGTDSCMSTLSTHMVGTQPESRPADQTSTTASDGDAAREASRHPCWALGHWRGGQSYASPFSRVIVHVTLSRR